MERDWTHIFTSLHLTDTFTFKLHICSCIPWEMNPWPWLLTPFFTVLYTAGLYIRETSWMNEHNFLYWHISYWNGKFHEPWVATCVLLLVACRWYYGGHSSPWQIFIGQTFPCLSTIQQYFGPFFCNINIVHFVIFIL